MYKVAVIGIHHSTEHEEYQEIMKNIKARFRPRMRVAFECPCPLSDIAYRASRSNDSTDWFLGNLYIHLQQAKVIALPVEDIRAHTLMKKRLKQLKTRGTKNAFTNDMMIYLSMYRSMRHLELAQKQNAELLITGGAHAYDLALWGYLNVAFDTSIKDPSALFAHRGRFSSRPWWQSLEERAQKSF